MKTVVKKIIYEPQRDLHWVRIIFLDKGGAKKTQVLASASQEYLEDLNKLEIGSSLNKNHINNWVEEVIKRWSRLKKQIFDQSVHFDVYSNSTEGEANGMNFLLSKAAVT